MVLRRPAMVVLLAALVALLLWWLLPGRSSTPTAVGPAHADSGFCGVRNDQGATYDTTWYAVRNKCSVAHNFAVRKHWIDVFGVHFIVQVGGCQRIPPHGIRYYSIGCPYCNYDNRWYVVNC